MEVEARLKAHDERLDAVNGSIEKTANNLEQIHRDIEVLKIDLNVREQVGKALAASVRDAAAKQVTTRQFYLGIGGFLLALVGLYLGAK